MITPFVDLYNYSHALFWILSIILFSILGTGAYAGISAAPWVPTKKRERRLLSKELNIKDKQTVYDLGCGTGTILFELAKHHKNTYFIGCEISIIPYLFAKFRSLFWKNVKIQYKNLFYEPIHNADVIVIFLLSKAYDRLMHKFKTELKDGAVIVVQGWAMETVRPYKKLKVDKALPFYLYKGSDFK